MNNRKLNLEDICTTYALLGHHRESEVVALHPDYKRRGRKAFTAKGDNTFPITRYIRSEFELARFCKMHHDDRMIAIGLNERPLIHRNEKGYMRAAKEEEIKICSNMLIDIDAEPSELSPSYLAKTTSLLEKLCAYYQDLGLKKPIIAFSGGGFHGMTALPRTPTDVYSDMAPRIKRFTTDLREDFRHDLSRHEMRIDTVSDLRRMVKVYGTAKVGNNQLSRLLSPGVRNEDVGMRNYLLSMTLKPSELEKKTMHKDVVIDVQKKLPRWFEMLIADDKRIHDLWWGRGKAKGDISASGYDHTLTRTLMGRGHKNLDDLATILAKRPLGSVQKSGKDQQYIQRTIANVLDSQSFEIER